MADRRDAFFNAGGRLGDLIHRRALSIVDFVVMNNEPSFKTGRPDEEAELLRRRQFLQSMGKWSGAALAAAVFGGAWLAFQPEANAGAWVNRRSYGGGGGWINRRGYGGGGWINGGGGGWVNRRSYGGGGSWINRW